MPHNNDPIHKLYDEIFNHTIFDSKLKTLKDLQEKLGQKQAINLLEKCDSQTLGGGVLNFAVKTRTLCVVAFLLTNISIEQSKLKLESESYKEYQALVDKAYKILTDMPEDKSQCGYLIPTCFYAYYIQRNCDIHKRKMLQESKSKDFYTSLGQDGIRIIITGALVVAAIMHPSDAFKVVFGALAVLVAIGTGLHIKNSTIPSYMDLQKNSIVNLKSLNSSKSL
ncbi:hypothetical protein IC220_01375 [Wolbachia endosymbiont of Pentalonia nigronervosa]|jgi:hypothetical protein|uniref:hypothetical protein n=1 Tax=Wolbachia endosymbiont of Pentalonia nigronervosa TaxID=1301914 RepID=UPI00165F460E|nr:hypothetical protein [Wolbachia endosymbiont of Pentalonia nigronervosa]MBD0391114.1 hypothetical protein [Wolbachia endosymbiont of Pentalonia nigronervosa]